MEPMSKKDFAVFAMTLKSFYPKEKNLLGNTQAMDAWHLQLQDLDYKVLMMVLNAWVATEKFPPTVADLREGYRTITGKEIGEWAAGWEKVQHAIRFIGFYREGEAMESFDKITRRCVQQLGYRNLCMSTMPETDRANFRMIYEQLAKREKKKDMLSLTMQENIQKIKELLNKDQNNPKIEQKEAENA